MHLLYTVHQLTVLLPTHLTLWVYHDVTFQRHRQKIIPRWSNKNQLSKATQIHRMCKRFHITTKMVELHCCQVLVMLLLFSSSPWHGLHSTAMHSHCEHQDVWFDLLICRGSKRLLNTKKVFCRITGLIGFITWPHKTEAVHRRRRESVSGDDEEGWKLFCVQQPAGMLNEA